MVNKQTDDVKQPPFEEVECLVPPAPELLEKIIRSQTVFASGKDLPPTSSADVLDYRTFTVIKSRPPRTRAHTLVETNREFAPVTGTKRVIVLLVDFSDKPGTQTLQHYKDLLFSSGTFATGSMRDYYAEVSYNKLTVTGEVFGWFRAPRPKTYYTNGQNGFGSYPQNAQKLVEDVVALANPTVNFAPYDNDGNGVIEAIVIIAAGSGAEQTGNPNDIWSHKWAISPLTVDGVRVQGYFMAPEDGRVGVMSHELGHLLLGQPDLYDTDYSSRGTGNWDLMAGGSWNNGGNTPAHPVAYVKAKVGWSVVTTIFNASQTVTLQPYKTSDKIFKLPIGAADSKQYFLLSNRRKLGFDSHIPGEGLLIEHVDENQGNNTDEMHYLCDVEQCDGRRDLNSNANSGDATDVFPSGGSTTGSFTVSTTPNSKAYDGSDSKVSVTEITKSGADITAKVAVGAAGGGTTAAWYNGKKVIQTFAASNSMNAWANIETIGWRQIQAVAPDAVTDMLIMFCEAVGSGQRVNVYADANTVSVAYFV
jgi:immune inhibitor A